jgi:hypothetical protein
MNGGNTSISPSATNALVTHLNGLLNGLVSLWENPISSALLAFFYYALWAHSKGPLLGVSPSPYYNYLADAFLHGQLHLRLLPSETYDLVFFGGHYYLYWPPFPAILLMPFVSLFGVRFSDIFFTLIIAGINVGLVALLLRQVDRKGIISISPLQRALLVLFLAFGTVHVTLASVGRVWFTGQLIGFACIALAYLAAVGLEGPQAFLLTGLALGGALLTRNHLVFAGIWPAYYLVRKHWGEGWKRLFLFLIAAGAPIIIAGLTFALYNYARFGSLTNVGLDFHQMANIYKADYRLYGAFNLHYVPTNLYYQYWFYPFPLRKESYLGGSLFLLSPVFFGAFWGLFRKDECLSTLALVASILMVNIPILLLMGTGWVQFGPRYTLDFTIPLLLLTAQGVRRWPILLLASLVVVSIVQFYFGMHFLMAAF